MEVSKLCTPNIWTWKHIKILSSTARSLIATIAEFFFGATETTTLSLMWTMLLITAHDDVRRKLQEEIDKVIPAGELNVTLADKPK